MNQSKARWIHLASSVVLSPPGLMIVYALVNGWKEVMGHVENAQFYYQAFGCWSWMLVLGWYWPCLIVSQAVWWLNKME